MSHGRKKPSPTTRSQPEAQPVPVRPRPRWFVRFVGVSGVLAGLLVAWLIFGPGPPPTTPEKSFPDPPFSSTRYLNVGAEAQFVGSEACGGCHHGKHLSYLQTAHSQALADVVPDAEPEGGSFVHKATGRSYRVYRRDGQMRHEEILLGAAGEKIARSDWPMRYRVGSGHFARTYVLEVDGFLHESPITWYASKKRWDMSPGYDRTEHMGFERPVTPLCLSCHGGHVESVDTVYRPTLIEKAIGCESCHGPGSLHVAARQAPKRAAAAEDLTIVHPARLSRPHLESVCGACHLQSVARVFVRGRKVGDFRPGMPLADYCIDYRLDSGSERMTVVGHMEQLRASKCYQKSADMTCLSCHNPHERTRPQDATAHYRQKCLNCHTDQSCKVSRPDRLKKNSADSCAACHMPRGDTDVPHVAFTHHRIGIHGKAPAKDSLQTPELVPLGDVAHLPPLDQQRNLGLAYLQAARNADCAPFAGEFAERARTILEQLYEAGLREADVTGALADLYLPIDPATSRKYAKQTLEAKRLSTEARANAVILLATLEMKEKKLSEAAALLKELVPVRRASEDWGLLGICRQMQNQPQEAAEAYRQALSIRPDQRALHAKLAEVYELLGDAGRAREHQDKARWLGQLPH